MAMKDIEPKTRLEYFLNKIAENNNGDGEQGGGVFLVNFTDTLGITTLSETFGAIKQAYLAGQNIRVVYTDEPATTYYNVYRLDIYTNGGGDVYVPEYGDDPFHAQSDLDYPTGKGK